MSTEQSIRVVMDGTEFALYAFKDFRLKAGQVLRVKRIDGPGDEIRLHLVIDDIPTPDKVN